MSQPTKGDKAPDFEIADHDGNPFRLSALRGTPVVLFFYPQDDTEGCTIENIEFSNLAPEFAALGVTLVGISPDSVKDHCAFREKYGLQIPLLADPEHKAVDAFGLWQSKVTFGREYVGLVRSSYFIDAKGKIAGHWKVTRIKNHAQIVLDAVRTALSAS